LSLTSYDRLFPNQDTMPKGGFGNLIALPLQKQPRESGRSAFVDEHLQPYPDQCREYLPLLPSTGFTDFQPDACLACHKSKACWSPSHNWGVVSNARDNLRAISGVIDPRSLTILEAVLRLMTSARAKEATDNPRGSKWCSRIIRPG
jgi:hypothetical protein